MQLCFRRFFLKFEALFLKTYLWFKVLPISSHYFFPFFWQLSDTISKKQCRSSTSKSRINLWCKLFSIEDRFESNSCHLREVLIFCFYLKKTATKAHRILLSTCGEAALMKKSKNGSIRGSPQKTHRSFEMVSENCQNDGKKYWLATDNTLNHK